MTTTDPVRSDEEFARQLQQEEFGNLLPSAWRPRSLNNNNNNNATNESSNANSQDMSAPLLNENPAAQNAPNPLLNDNSDNNNNNLQNGNNNAAQRARRNVIGHVRDADTDSPRILLLRITMALFEIIATSTILAIGWKEGGNSSCNYLKYWALVYTARHLITIPLRVHIYRMNRQSQNNEENDANMNAQNAQKSIQILRWLSIMTFLLFLLGQTFLFTEKQCQDSAPTVWYYCLVIIILVYVSLALPFLIVLAICICLPCVLIIFRFFAEPEGADDRIIKDLPTRKITEVDLAPNGDANVDGNVDEDEDEENEDGPSCAICMQQYKVGDELRILPCSHEFHCECVDKWLPMKKICPLCRHDVTKKMTSNQNGDENV